jgi:hypothetical protein
VSGVPSGEFSVWVFYPDDTHSPVERFTDAETAVRMAHTVTRVVGTAVRVIITDGGDCTVFEWRKGEGVTWPKPADAS